MVYTIYLHVELTSKAPISTVLLVFVGGGGGGGGGSVP